MTLKEKFQKVTYWWRVADEAEQIADDFAIGFAKWIQYHSELWIKYKTSELLEIYKKEKGL